MSKRASSRHRCRVTEGRTAGELAERLGGRLVGDPATGFDHFDSLEAAGEGALSFATSPRYGEALKGSGASVVLLSEALLAFRSSGTAIVVDNPHAAFALAVQWFLGDADPKGGIHPSAVVAEEAQVHPEASIGPQCVIGAGTWIGAGAIIGPGCVIGRQVCIGEQSELVARVTVLDDVRIGRRCVIQPGAVIGSEGFGLARDGGRWLRVPQLGTVLIGDDVDIGANTTVDRGAIEDTVIADGAKLDNLIQIAHNVEIGEHSAIAGCAGLAGSSKVGRHCSLAGGVGLAGHLQLADNVHVTGMSMVTRSITQPGIYSAGTPLDTNRNWHRNAVRFKQLDQMARRLARLERGDDHDNQSG